MTERKAQLFERLSPVDKRPDSVGIGLWIVRTLAEANDGDIGYLMTATGPEFRITLPSAPPDTVQS